MLTPWGGLWKLWGLSLPSGIGTKSFAPIILNSFPVSSSCTLPSLWSIHSLGWVSQGHTSRNSTVITYILRMIVVKSERVSASLGRRMTWYLSNQRKGLLSSLTLEEAQFMAIWGKKLTNHIVWKPYPHLTSLSLNALEGDCYRLNICVPPEFICWNPHPARGGR